MPDNNTPGGVSLLTLSAVMRYCNNYFVRDTHTGSFTISGGVLDGTGAYLKPGQYYRVMGSVFSDGVHRYGDDILSDETFSGRVDALAPPPDFLALASDIEHWQAQYGAVAASPYSSEHFKDYDYTKASGVAESGFGGWEAMFRAKLARYRKL